MSNNLITNEDFYNWLVNINNLDFSDKSVLLIGAGNIAQHYAQAISKLGIKNTSVISNSETTVSLLCDEFNFKGYSGGYEKNLDQMEVKYIESKINYLRQFKLKFKLQLTTLR